MGCQSHETIKNYYYESQINYYNNAKNTIRMISDSTLGRKEEYGKGMLKIM